MLMYPEFDNFIIKVDANSPAHPDGHRLSVQRGQSCFEMLHQIGGDKRNALLSTDQCLDGRPIGLEFFGLGKRVVFDKHFNLHVDTGLLFVIQVRFRAKRLSS